MVLRIDFPKGIFGISIYYDYLILCIEVNKWILWKTSNLNFVIYVGR